MKTTIISSVTGALGLLSGIYIGWRFTKKKYEMLADEEVDAVKAALTSHYEKLIPISVVVDKKPKLDAKPVPADKDIPAYVDYAAKYKPESAPDRIPGKPESDKLDKKETKVDKSPYIISPDEFSNSEYEIKTLMYYKDKVLADEDYNIIHDVVGHVGDEALSDFGRYGSDSVYVRNDALGIDYEILLVEMYFYKVAPRTKPGNDGGDHTEND